MLRNNCCPFYFCYHLDGEERGGERESWFVFLMSCDCLCSVAPPHGAVSWSTVCDCVFILAKSKVQCSFYRLYMAAAIYEASSTIEKTIDMPFVKHILKSSIRMLQNIKHILQKKKRF